MRRARLNAAGAFDFKPFSGLSLDADEATSEEVETEDSPASGEEEGLTGETAEPDEGEILSMMMDGATPLERSRETFDRSKEISEGPKRMSDAELVMRHLDDLVYGSAPFELADTDEYIEGAVQGLDRRIVKKLRRGEFSVQAHLDLHGYRREEARVQVADFVERSALAGKRCVLIVHGRGMGSKDNIPVLKEKLTLVAHPRGDESAGARLHLGPAVGRRRRRGVRAPEGVTSFFRKPFFETAD